MPTKHQAPSVCLLHKFDLLSEKGDDADPGHFWRKTLSFCRCSKCLTHFLFLTGRSIRGDGNGDGLSGEMNLAEGSGDLGSSSEFIM